MKDLWVHTFGDFVWRKWNIFVSAYEMALIVRFLNQIPPPCMKNVKIGHTLRFYVHCGSEHMIVKLW